MNRQLRRLTALVLVLVCVLAGSALAELPKLNPNDPVVINGWVYYNGPQQQTFERLVQEFNDTVGAEMGIVVVVESQGTIDALTQKVLASAKQEVAAEEMPNFFAAYADTAYQLNQMGQVADISQYLTQAEMDEYIDAYIHEGILDSTGAVKIFPIAKSTELLVLNETAWGPFAAETGADISKLATWEGIVELAESYYNWTDSQTEEPGDGKAFFGRDAFANYILIGSLQLGVEIFEVNDGVLNLQVDEQVMRKLWDHYYVPYVSGWFGAYGRFRSDDIKTGQIISLVGSTSGALYFPTEVTQDDGQTSPIESSTHVLPNFAGTDPVAVQQGAGMVVAESNPASEYAATVFLKWFSDAKNNIDFSINSGYLPVKKEANDPAVLVAAMEARETPDSIRRIVETGVGITSSYRMYTNNAFEHGYEARHVLDTSMVIAADAALAKRIALQAEGSSYEEAVQAVTTDEAFETWLTQFMQELDTALKK